MVINTLDKLAPVRCQIDSALLERLDRWGRLLVMRPDIGVHFGGSLPLGYSARTALLIGLESIKESFEAYAPVGQITPFSVAMPLWLREELDTLAKRHNVSRLEIIRAALHEGLP